jgi:hypothetical protein
MVWISRWSMIVFRKPVSTPDQVWGKLFPDHALTLPVQHRDQREQPSRRAEIELDLAFEPLHEDVRALVVQ